MFRACGRARVISCRTRRQQLHHFGTAWPILDGTTVVHAITTRPLCNHRRRARSRPAAATTTILGVGHGRRPSRERRAGQFPCRTTSATTSIHQERTPSSLVAEMCSVSDADGVPIHAQRDRRRAPFLLGAASNKVACRALAISSRAIGDLRGRSP